MQIVPFVAHTSFLSLRIVWFNNCLTLTCQENVSLTFSQMQKRCSQGSTHLLSAMWLSFSDHIQECRRHCTGCVFFKSSICLKLFKDLEINLLKMKSSKKDSIKALTFCIKAAHSLKSRTKNPQEFSICTKVKSILNKNNFGKNSLCTAKHWVWI